MNKKIKMLFFLAMSGLFVPSLTKAVDEKKTIQDLKETSEKSIVIVSASRNARKYCIKNLESILNQNYANYRVIWIDDDSQDGTAELVEGYLKNHDSTNKVTLIKNKQRLFAAENYFRAIYSCNDKDIIVIVDGDDWLKHNDVLQVVNKAYEHDVWLTYGTDEPVVPWKYNFNKEISEQVIKDNDIRNQSWTTGHLRTFYTWLFKKIKLNDFIYQNEFIKTHWDVVSMIPMVEMAGFHTKFISEVLYVYNNQSDYNDFKNKDYHKEHIKFDKYFTALPKYTPLEI